jgi:hypothetical protein
MPTITVERAPTAVASAPTPSSSPLKNRDAPPEGLAAQLPFSAGEGEPTAVASAPTPSSSPLKNRDAPPEGVAAQLEFGGGGGDGCQAAVTPDQETTADVTAIVEIAQRTVMCFWGFWPDKPVIFEITYPDGTVETGQVMPQDGLTWHSLPGKPLGEYVLAAYQGERRTQAHFNVVPATFHNILVLPEIGAPGTTFTIALAGFTPHTRIPLYLYKEEDWEEYSYISTIGSATTNDRGEAVTVYATQYDDPEDNYYIDTKPSAYDRTLERLPDAGFSIDSCLR